MAKYGAAIITILLTCVDAGGPAGAADLLTLPPLTGGLVIEGGRQPFGPSDADDPLNGLGKLTNPLDAPIQGDLDRNRDRVVVAPAPKLQPVQRPPMSRLPCLGAAARMPGQPGRVDKWRCPALR